MMEFLCILCFIIGLITKLIRGHLFDKLEKSFHLDYKNQSFEEFMEDVKELAKNGNSQAKLAIIIDRINVAVVCLGIGLILLAVA